MRQVAGTPTSGEADAPATGALRTARCLQQILEQRAERSGSVPALAFLDRELRVASELSYAQLHSAALAVAAHVARAAAPGERVLLCLSDHREFALAFWGCMFAGCVAVPLAPAAARVPLESIARIAADCSARMALVPDGPPGRRIADALGSCLQVSSLSAARCEPAAGVGPREVAPDALAVIQYTSGSTGFPKGVAVSHANLLHNLEKIRVRFAHGAASRGLMWLPPYHDMGLVGGMLQPIYAGFPVSFLAALDFLQRPVRWLAAVSALRATTSGGPNFAYDLCVRQIAEEELAGLDLSSWAVAFSGAEPVRTRTMSDFVGKFARVGFRERAIMVCYGLAEATLLVAAGGAQQAGVQGAEEVLSSGSCAADEELIVVDPRSGLAREEGQSGEIWLRSASVARGYWNRPELSEQTFRARRVGSLHAYLRTGDIGLLRAGRLSVLGRLKDIIIVHGRKHHPVDLEATVAGSHPLLRAGESVVFAIAHDGQERVVVAHELASRRDEAQLLDELRAVVRGALSEHHGLQVHDILFVRARTLPRTSSGKPRRDALRGLYEAGLFAGSRAHVAPRRISAVPEASS